MPAYLHVTYADKSSAEIELKQVFSLSLFLSLSLSFSLSLSLPLLSLPLGED